MVWPFSVKASQRERDHTHPRHIGPRGLQLPMGTPAHAHPKLQPDPPQGPQTQRPDPCKFRPRSSLSLPTAPTHSCTWHRVLGDRASGTELVTTDALTPEPPWPGHCDEHRSTATPTTRSPPDLNQRNSSAMLTHLTPHPTRVSAETAGALTQSFRSHRSRCRWPATQASRGTGTPQG